MITVETYNPNLYPIVDPVVKLS